MLKVQKVRMLLCFTLACLVLSYGHEVLFPTSGLATNVAKAQEETNDKRVFTVYWAGELFTHAHLRGNVSLRNDLLKVSNGRYVGRLPQSIAPNGETSALSLRNADIIAVASADVVIVNFEGPELDAGTVSEFMVAKDLGIPVVVLRSDGRRDGKGLDEPFNLMLKNWPRVKLVSLNSIAEYGAQFATELKEAGGQDASAEAFRNAELRAVNALSESIAKRLATALEEVLLIPATFSAETAKVRYRSLRDYAGGSLSIDDDAIEKLIARKQKNGSL